MSKGLKNVICFALVALLSGFIVMSVNAQINYEDFNVNTIANDAGLNSSVTPGKAISNIIKLVLALLGVIALIIIIIGGFQWMTSGGDSSKIDASKKLMMNGIIGLVIILLAFVIQQFVVNLIFGVVNGNEAA